MNMIVLPNEADSWFGDYPDNVHSLMQAYRACISNMLPCLSKDPRFINNTHIVNMDFDHEPQFVLGFHKNPRAPILVISILYVFPDYRTRGLAKNAIQQLQHSAGQDGILQVAVEAERNCFLKDFYKNLGFISSDKVIKDPLGREYVDYFWSANSLTLEHFGNQIIIKRKDDRQISNLI
ncbi:GNAT family N-acetyltransferase [Vibrio cincinnatiensis]|nr:GNAT family N-acetyltransferase [Vibrio cincinnatiensis]MCG3740688.1 GNAT family N-acetyltransferase [Vibrio cincinnatiensis]